MYIHYNNKELLVTLKPEVLGSDQLPFLGRIKWAGTVDVDGHMNLVLSFTENKSFVETLDLVDDGVQTSRNVLFDRLNAFLHVYRQNEQFGLENTDAPEETEPVPYDPDKITIRRDTFPIFQIFKMIEDGDINLSPDFQRNLVWDNIRKSRLIESVLLGIPLPVFYFSENRDGTFNVVDGLQRLSSIRQFMKNEYRLRNLEYLKSDCENKYYKSDIDNKITEAKAIERKFSRRIEQAQLVVNVIEAKSPTKVKYDIFKRINEGGRPLNNQEIRNSMATPDTRTYLREMAASKYFLNATGGSVNDTRMDAQELVLRFTAFYLRQRGVLNYVGSMNSFLDDALEVLNSYRNTDFKEVRYRFKAAMENSYHLFGNYCFRKCLTEHLQIGAPRQLINKSLFTTWSIELCERDYETISKKVVFESFTNILASELDKREEYYDAVTTSTTDRKILSIAFEYTKHLLKQHLDI